MFSGIVEEYAEVVRIVKEQENLHLTLKSGIAVSIMMLFLMVYYLKMYSILNILNVT